MTTDLPNTQGPGGPQTPPPNNYFRNIGIATRTLLHGLKLTWRHFLQARNSRKPVGVEDKHYFEQGTGIFTLQYPKESLPVPDNGRYRLHNEIEDCIVCDKCAKVCPVDCIEIEPIKAVEPIGQTSDGTSKRIYAARFDIDMAKCCFCGLCTTVCPTECLTMTKVYDFSEFDVADHTYAFSEMTPLEILQKRKELEAQQAQKAAKPAAARPAAARPGVARPSVARPAASKPAAPEEGVQETARRLMEQKKAAETSAAEGALAQLPNPTPKSAPMPEGTEDSPAPGAEKPKFRPRVVVKPKTQAQAAGGEEASAAPKAETPASTTSKPATPQQEAGKPAAAKPRPVMRPVVKKASPSGEVPAGEQKEAAAPENAQPAVPKPAKPRPVMRPVVKKASGEANEAKPAEQAEVSGTDAPQAETPVPATTKPSGARPRPVIKPVIKKADAPEQDQQAKVPSAAEPKKKPKPVVKPVISKRPMQAEEKPDKNGADEEAIKQPKPVVEKKVVVRKPEHDDLTEEDKRQEGGQLPEPPGRPD